MSAQPAFTTHIDGMQFARREQSVEGGFAVKDMPRLRETLASRDGEIRYRIEGRFQANDRPVLECNISGLVELQCQRCLEPINHPLRIQSRLVLVSSEAALPDTQDEPDEADTIVASHEMNVAELVEEEILLSLPLVPRHEVCELATAGKQEKSLGGLAALAALKKNQSKKLNDS
ncbi:MAG: YceD family protein [Burkholderiales bacterium]